MLRDFIIRTDHEIKVWRSDLLVTDKTENNYQIIDVPIPDDGRVGAKEEEKVEKYHLEREIRKMWGIRTNTHSAGGIGDNTAEVKRKSEDHKCQHIH